MCVGGLWGGGGGGGWREVAFVVLLAHGFLFYFGFFFPLSSSFFISVFFFFLDTSGWPWAAEGTWIAYLVAGWTALAWGHAVGMLLPVAGSAWPRSKSACLAAPPPREQPSRAEGQRKRGQQQRWKR